MQIVEGNDSPDSPPKAEVLQATNSGDETEEDELLADDILLRKRREENTMG